MNVKSYKLTSKNITNITITIIYLIAMVILLFIYKNTSLYLLSCLLIFIFGEGTKTDLDRRIIPNSYMAYGLLLGICEAILHFTISKSFYVSFTDSLIGLLVLPVILLIMSLVFGYLLKTEAFGMGDIKAFSVVGFILGYQFQLVFAFFIFIFAFIGTIFIAIKEKNIKVAIPMMPFMFISLFITLAIAGITMF